MEVHLLSVDFSNMLRQQICINPYLAAFGPLTFCSGWHFSQRPSGSRQLWRGTRKQVGRRIPPLVHRSCPVDEVPALPNQASLHQCAGVSIFQYKQCSSLSALMQ